MCLVLWWHSFGEESHLVEFGDGGSLEQPHFIVEILSDGTIWFQVQVTCGDQGSHRDILESCDEEFLHRGPVKRRENRNDVMCEPREGIAIKMADHEALLVLILLIVHYQVKNVEPRVDVDGFILSVECSNDALERMMCR